MYRKYIRSILPYHFDNSHPRFWGWVTGGGLVSGAPRITARFNRPYHERLLVLDPVRPYRDLEHHGLVRSAGRGEAYGRKADDPLLLGGPFLGQEAVELLGFGNNSLRRVPANDSLQIDIAVLRQLIAAARTRGCHTVCIVGAAGITNTVDDLNALADIYAEERCWFHVDGASVPG